MSASPVPRDFSPLDETGLGPSLAWSGASLTEEAARLYSHLAVLSDPAGSAARYPHLLDLFYGQVHKLSAQIKLSLRDCQLPLCHELRENVRQTMELLSAIASGYRWVLGQKVLEHSPRPVMGRMMRCLAEQLALTTLTALPAPGGLWYGAYQLFLEARLSLSSESKLMPTDAERIFREMLALSACTLESLSAREFLLVEEYVAMFASAVVVMDDLPEAGGEGALYWMDMAADQAPTALLRRGPSAAFDQVLYFSCAALANVVDGQIRGLENGGKPVDLRLPPSAKEEPGYVALLRQLQRRWREPPKRLYPRRAAQNSVMQVCAGFDEFWRLLEQQDQGMPALDVGMVSEWSVINTSPTGYALAQTQGLVTGLKNGSVVAVRTKPGQAWEVCVVRWLCCRESDQGLDMGLQVVASGALPVRVGFLGVKNAQVELGLMFEPVPMLRPKPSILTRVGTGRSKRFVMVSGSSRIYVAQANLLAMDWQTSSVELFQFEVDQRPQ